MKLSQLRKIVREELEKYDGGFTDEWNDQRKKNAEVLGYKLSGKSDIKEAVKDPKLKVGQKIRYKNDSRRLYTLKKITHGNRGIPEDPAGTSYMFVASGNRKEYHTKKTWAQAIKKGWIIKESINESGMGILDKDQTDVLHAIVMRNKNKNSNSILKIALKDRMFKGIDKRELLGYIEGAKQFVRYMGRTGNESVNETQKRDYKAEYKKFQSSTKAKKYRAELNQYNRKKGTYGNNDGKDASHKGGKIVGFEKESTNRGRREKSRLKKEDIREDIGLDVYLGGIIKAMRKSRLKPKTAKVMKHGFSKSKDKIGFFIDVEKREIEGKKLWTLQLEVDRDGYLWYLSAPKDIKIGKWADTSQLVRGFKKLDRLPGFGQDAIFKRRR